MGLMDSLFGSSQTTQSSGDPVKQAAFNQALPFWQQALGSASALNNDITANPAYSGQRVADLNPYQVSSANSLGNYAAQTAGMPSAFNNVGLNNLQAGNNFGSNANSIYSLAGYDPTNYVLNTANQYANNPYVNGVISAANRDVVRDLGENQLAGINRAAEGTGNVNSSRAGVQDAIAQRGAMDRMADTAANIRSQFFGQGLSQAQNQWNQNITNQLNANNQLLSASNLGSNLLGAGQTYAGNNFNQGQSAGGVFQNQNQNVLNGNMNQFNESIQNRIAALNALNGTVGAGQGWGGGPTTSTTTGTPSLVSALGGAALGAGTLMKGWAAL